MKKVALVIIYNHRYDKNIEILEEIYKDRFRSIYHLIPFYNGDKSNVIPVYENSFYFQGYVAQGFKNFFHPDFIHYFFIADDMVLNPIINENNYAEHLKLEEHSCFLPGFINLHECINWWPRVGEAFRYNPKNIEVEARNYYPNRVDALKSFEKHGLEIKPLYFKQIYEKPLFPKNFTFKKISRYFYWQLRHLINKNKKYNLSYPIVGSYSDIFIISSSAIKQFCQYCGVFAATRLFVEIGLPTALVLSAEKIVTEKDLKLQGKALWTEEEYSILEKYENQLEKLLNDFPSNYLYLHPVKLSKWNTKL